MRKGKRQTIRKRETVRQKEKERRKGKSEERHERKKEWTVNPKNKFLIFHKIVLKFC